jgi:glycosyltransferase involved in cell wall biosynthesis
MGTVLGTARRRKRRSIPMDCDRNEAVPVEGVTCRNDRLRALSVFVRLSSQPIPRVARMMSVASDLGLEPLFIGAYRGEGFVARDSWGGVQVERIGHVFPLLNGTRPGLYAYSVIRFGISLLFKLRKLRPELVHVSDFEAYWPARVYATVAGIPLIYNIHDNLSQRYRCSAWLAQLLNWAEGIAAKCATVTLVPESFRRTSLPPWAQGNTRVVRNAPANPGAASPIPLWTGEVTLFFGGWIDSGRGIDGLAAVVQANPALLMRVAGDGDRKIFDRLESVQGVSFLGFLPHEQIMKETASCDFVTALYDPGRPINRFAASNKIAEALALGRPIVINRGMKIGELLEGYRCTVTVDYEDLAGLGEELIRIRSSEEQYARMCAGARAAYEDNYTWETVRDASIDAFRAAGVGDSTKKSRGGPDRLPQTGPS